MRKIGFGLIAISFVMGISTTYLPDDFLIEPVVFLAFFYFLLGIYILIKEKDGTTGS